MKRKDMNDLVFMSKEEKLEAIVEETRRIIENKAPVLVGTASVETSEELSEYFKQAGIEHKVLNAKYHEQEAEIIAQAGRPGVVTIATNMAGRGTDIVLGGILRPSLQDSMTRRLRKQRARHGKSVIKPSSMPVVFTSWVPSVTSHAGLITSSAVAQGVRVTLVHRAFTYRSTTT